MKASNNFLLFLKGMLMGICDLIPGISGGTVAFITGIYTRLINAVKSFSFSLFYDFFKNKGKFKEDLRNLDLGFLLILILGIFTSIILGARIIHFLLENYYSFTLSFFIGLIIASSKIIFDNIKKHNFKNIFFGIFGILTGISLAFIIPVNVTPSFSYVFFGGFIAISAMFLPGISGAFILLIMSLYEFMIDVIGNIRENFFYAFIFLLGAVLGAFFISRLISFLFKKDKCKTLYFLLGLVIGALSIPIKKIIAITNFTLYNSFTMIILFILGVVLVVVVNSYGK
ncbi:DUF368 domain-containing protein [Candidatus Pacearchaeota archaeon]|nr:DUF368 domain-containing protein [Candidatus Pacearchaeota archaeon]MBD3283696.1 DUF368 domain-containing protein [Candidatus Pacearchaeota archaeon]